MKKSLYHNYRHKFLVFLCCPSFGLYISLGIIGVLISSTEVQAQQRCGTVEYENYLRSRNSNMESLEQFEKWIDKKLTLKHFEAFKDDGSDKEPYKIPVVIHIIHNGEEIGQGSNLSVEQILSQLNVLNNDFNRLNADTINTIPRFRKYAGRINIQFVLAKTDPNGLPTSGITRSKGDKLIWEKSFDDSHLKSIDYWPAENYINIWVCNLGFGDIGYSSIPESSLVNGLRRHTSELERQTDGIVIHYEVFGSGYYSLLEPYNYGRTLTHEVGHYFGLRHIWGDGDDDGKECLSDYVDDTPAQATSSIGKCPNLKSKPFISCGNENMVQNFMDYTNDACMNIFSMGQVERMRIVLENSPRRLSLLTSPAHTSSPKSIDVVLEKIISPSVVHCKANSEIKFRIKNLGPLNLVSFKIRYSVNSGKEQISDFSHIGLEVNETKDFSINSIALNEGNNIVSVTLIEPNYSKDLNSANNTKTIATIVDTSTEIVPFRLTFDSPNTEKSWTPSGPENFVSWKPKITNKDNSFVFNAFSAQKMYNNEAWLVSPTLDLSQHDSYSLFFDVSYAHNSYADSLKLMASIDCGVTFDKILWSKSGSDFKVANSENEWFPKTDSDWKKQYVNLSSIANNNNVRIALQGINQNGNNLFIDNIEFFIGDTKNPAVTSLDYKLFYPSSINRSKVGVVFSFKDKKNVELQIYSILGQEIFREKLFNILNQTLYYDLSNVSKGIYFLNLSTEGGSHATKFLIDN